MSTSYPSTPISGRRGRERRRIQRFSGCQPRHEAYPFKTEKERMSKNHVFSSEFGLRQLQWVYQIPLSKRGSSCLASHSDSKGLFH